jgi:short-subunit dehydrogenase
MDRRRNFAGARCLVTGASSGLGRAMAELLVRDGARVLLTGRSVPRLTEAADRLIANGADPAAVLFHPADLTIEADRASLIDRAKSEFGGALDLVINSAGVGATGHFDTHDPTILRRVFEINVVALAEIIRLVAPLLALGNAPSLVNLGSIVARRGLPGRTEYSASKFAVAGFTESIRSEWARHGIHVMLLNPGFTATEFESNLLADTAIMKVTERRTATPEQVAAAALRAIRRRKNELTLTRDGRLLLLVNRLFPRLVDRGLDRFTRTIFRSHPRP